MDNNENLIGKEAVSKLKELAEDIDFTMMATNLNENPFHVIPMSTKKVDEFGNIWFLSSRESEHNKHILEDGTVQLIYSKPSDMEFMTIYGKASIKLDKQIISELYGSSDDMWFDGEDDPNVSAIAVKPTQAHYWEPKHNKFVTLFKLGMGALKGEQPDLSDQGSLSI